MMIIFGLLIRIFLFGYLIFPLHIVQFNVISQSLHHLTPAQIPTLQLPAWIQTTLPQVPPE